MIFTVNGLKDKKFMIISIKFFFPNLVNLRNFDFQELSESYVLFSQFDEAIMECLCPAKNMEKVLASTCNQRLLL